MTACYWTEHHELFDMDGADPDVHAPFAMDDDYGEFVDLDSDDDGAASSAAGTAIPAPPPPPSDDGYGSDASPPPPACGGGGCGRLADRADPGGLASSPPLLTPAIAEYIAEEGLPWSLQDARWDRLFASGRDGTSFGTFMRRVRGRGPTVVVVRTTGGATYGGYAAGAWSGRRPAGAGEGSPGDAFLFVVGPPASSAKGGDAAAPGRAPSLRHTFIPGLSGALGSSPTSIFDLELLPPPPAAAAGRPRVGIYKAPRVGADGAPGGLRQACQVGNKSLSLGDAGASPGGAGLGLAVEASFARGTAVTPEGREEFDVAAFEVYGLSEED